MIFESYEKNDWKIKKFLKNKNHPIYQNTHFIKVIVIGLGSSEKMIEIPLILKLLFYWLKFDIGFKNLMVQFKKFWKIF